METDSSQWGERSKWERLKNSTEFIVFLNNSHAIFALLWCIGPVTDSAQIKLQALTGPSSWLLTWRYSSHCYQQTPQSYLLSRLFINIQTNLDCTDPCGTSFQTIVLTPWGRVIVAAYSVVGRSLLRVRRPGKSCPNITGNRFSAPAVLKRHITSSNTTRSAVTLKLYADDVKLYSNIKTSSLDIAADLQEQLDKLATFAEIWQLPI